jgi:hypothetical protein|tara:strand:- start:602 stop:1126 length:525 start_codon:yes stop_codon:yes gene_type:complete
MSLTQQTNISDKGISLEELQAQKSPTQFSGSASSIGDNSLVLFTESGQNGEVEASTSIPLADLGTKKIKLIVGSKEYFATNNITFQLEAAQTGTMSVILYKSQDVTPLTSTSNTLVFSLVQQVSFTYSSADVLQTLSEPFVYVEEATGIYVYTLAFVNKTGGTIGLTYFNANLF